MLVWPGGAAEPVPWAQRISARVPKRLNPALLLETGGRQYISRDMNRTQVKVPRAALRWSAVGLADGSEVGPRIIARFESGEAVQTDTSERLRAAFVANGGIAFTTGAWRAGVPDARGD